MPLCRLRHCLSEQGAIGVENRNDASFHLPKVGERTLRVNPGNRPSETREPGADPGEANQRIGCSGHTELQFDNAPRYWRDIV